MDWNAVIQLISTLGFPIVCCIVLFWYMIKQTDMHKEEINELKKSIDNNTIILTRLYEELGGSNE